MAQGLSVGRLVRTSVNLSPKAAQRRGFGTLLILGDSPVIGVSEGLRSYTAAEQVAAAFGLNSPEAQAALVYYGQSPKPINLMIGRWARVATPGQLRGGVITVIEQQLASWTAITAGSFKISVPGTAAGVNVVGMNFSAQTNMNGIATVINAALVTAGVAASVVWDGQRFVFSTTAAGVAATISYLSAAGVGVDISAKLKGTSATASVPTAGVAEESPVDAVARAVAKSGMWFGVVFAASIQPTDDQCMAVASYVEALELDRCFAATITTTPVLDPTNTDNLARRMKAAGFGRSTTQYSANPYAAASLLGRSFSVNFSANRSTITLMYKQEPSITAELLDETQAQALRAANCNVFVQYINDTAIIQYGTMANGTWFDEMHGLSWFKDALQNAEYNLLYQSKTKVQQTDNGQNELVACASAACEEAINNGLIAPGQWNAEGFGQLSRGDFLKDGFYIFTSPMALQDQSLRESRVAPPLQIAIKLAGAFQELDILVDVNR